MQDDFINRLKGMAGMAGMDGILGKLPELQRGYQELQQELGRLAINGEAGAGLVKVTVNGLGEVQHIELAESLMTPEQRTICQDLIVAAHNNARQAAKHEVKQATASLMQRFGLPADFSFPGMA